MNGLPDAAARRAGSTRPIWRNISIARPNAPTPGRITPSAETIRSGSLVSSDAHPSRSRAYLTLSRLPRP